MPDHPEYAVGALTEDGEIFLNTEQMKYSHISESDLQPTIQEEMEEAQRRLKVYRAGRPPRQFAGKKLIIVDDGLATVRVFSWLCNQNG
jgi:putative phosphoribosyl transferase